ncbi:MAG TPA: hypothetical protein VGB43_02450 [Flavobacterium sp.]|jgi:hypothetical protein
MEDQHRDQPDTPVNRELQDNETTGSGLSQAERRNQDGTNSSIIDHSGAGDLVDSFNINDKAHSDSSIDDFIPTKSNYHHAEKPDDGPENDSIH